MSDRTRRIDLDDAGRLDDVAISDVSMFRLERMDTGTWWVAVYYEDGGRDTFCLHSKKKIDAHHEDERSVPLPPQGD
jgi:hypothetical protein